MDANTDANTDAMKAIVVSSPKAASEALLSNKTVILYTGEPVEGSAEAMNIKEICYVWLTEHGRKKITSHGVSANDSKCQILCIPTAPDQVKYMGMSGGGFQTSITEGGLIERVEKL